MSKSYGRLQLGPTPSDIEFAALETSITILPSFSLDAFTSLDSRTTYGPLVPPKKVEVPLWMALHLKKKRKCRIVVPAWLSVGELGGFLARETSETDFSELPRDWLEISKVLLECAPDDIMRCDEVRILLKDVREARQSKMREGLGALNPIHLEMPNLSTLEINELRPFFLRAHARLVVLDPENERTGEIEKMWIEKPAEGRRRAERGLFEAGGEGIGGDDYGDDGMDY